MSRNLKNNTFFCRIIWRFVEKVLPLQRQKVNRLFRLVVIDLGF